MTDAPDFQTVTQQHGDVIVIVSGVIAAGTQTLFQGASSSWASFQLRATMNSGSGIFIVDWFADSAMTEGVGNDAWLVSAVCGLSAIYPVQAPFCKVKFDCTDTSAQSGTLYVVGTQIPAESIRYLTTAQVVQVLGATVAAGGEDIYNPGFLARGPATLAMNHLDATGKITFDVVTTDQHGNVTAFVIRVPGPTVDTQVNFYCPDLPLQVLVVNTDAVAGHPYDVMLTIPSG